MTYSYQTGLGLLSKAREGSSRSTARPTQGWGLRGQICRPYTFFYAELPNMTR